MKTFCLVSLTFLILVSNSLAESLPKRKAGLWEIVVSGGGKSGSSKRCVGAQDDLAGIEKRNKSMESHGMKCSDKITKAANDYVQETKCVKDGKVTSTKSIYVGDFSSAYTVITVVERAPGKVADVNKKYTFKGTYLGESCAEGQKLGKITPPDGKIADPKEKSALSAAPKIKK